MNTLYLTPPRSEWTGISLEALMTKVLDLTKADWIRLSFDGVAGKVFPGCIRKYSHALALTDFAHRATDHLNLDVSGDQPVILSAITPFERLIYIPFNESSDKFLLMLGFLEEVRQPNEIISEIRSCGEYIQMALRQYKLEDAAGERKFLLTFSAAVSSVKNKGQLLRVINCQLKNYLKFSHATIFILDSEQNTVFDYLADQGAGERANPFHRLIRILPDYFNFDEISETHSILPYLDPHTVVAGTGGLVVNLYREDTVIAHLAIAFESKCIDSYGPIRIIANLLSTILLKLRAEEIGAQREAESELLQSLNIDFASIRDKDDLLRIIQYKLKKLFEFGYHWVAVIDEDQQTITSFLQDPSLKTKDHPLYQHMTTAKYSTNDRIFNKVLLSKEPHIFDLDQLNARPNMPEYMAILYESGIRKVAMIGLQVGERIIGIWAIYLHADQEMSAGQLSLIGAISSQLSIAVDNITANMALSRKEAERELLLEFSFSLTSIRDRSHLYKVIKNSLKKMISFSDLVVLVGHEGNPKSSIFLSTMELPPDVESVQWQAVRNVYFERIMESEGVTVLNGEKIGEDCNSSRNMICIGLRENNYYICLFFLITDAGNHYTDHELELIKAISYQLSPAIANILANEDIRHREKEKELLLAFSNAITSVRDKDILAKILKQQLRDLFDISDYVIHSLSDDKQTYTPILFDPDANFAQLPDFRNLIGRRNNVNDGIFDKILASEDPVHFDIGQCLDEPGHPDYLKSAREIKLQQMVGVCIRLGQESIALMTFMHDDYDRIVGQFQLFKSILSQIALSVSNMVANEKVNRQLEEINNYKHLLEEEKIYLKQEIETTLNYAEIVGESHVMQKVFRLVAQVAPSDSTVLILGETGTGKELIARAIHNNSPRKSKLMVKVNCAALPANLIESELFGHERGSFTGATDRRLGKFELANNGTLFLDEVGEMPLDLQVKLLRALQEREIERVGGNTTIKVNVRVIAATNRDLEKEMDEGRFRKDLYYRLNIFPIELPPLRDRKEDIPLLALFFIQRFAKKAGKEILTLNNRALHELVQYKWPGNIRELEHLIERSVLLAPGDTIKEVHLPAGKQQSVVAEEAEFVVKTIDEQEREFILKTLKYCSGRIGGHGGAAMLLGVPPSTLNSKIKRLGIRKEHVTMSEKRFNHGK